MELVEHITIILSDLGYYKNRVLAEGDILVGVRCERNGCTALEIGDEVRPLLISTTDVSMYRHGGMHARHHQEAIKAIEGIMGGSE